MSYPIRITYGVVLTLNGQHKKYFNPRQRSKWQHHNEVKWSWFCNLSPVPSQCWQAVSDLFLFKFLSRVRKVLRFCGNINSVLLHITCHPGRLWLISTYFSSWATVQPKPHTNGAEWGFYSVCAMFFMSLTEFV